MPVIHSGYRFVARPRQRPAGRGEAGEPGADLVAAAAGPLLEPFVAEVGHRVEVGRDQLLEEPGVPGGVDRGVRVARPGRGRRAHGRPRRPARRAGRGSSPRGARPGPRSRAGRWTAASATARRWRRPAPARRRRPGSPRRATGRAPRSGASTAAAAPAVLTTSGTSGRSACAARPCRSSARCRGRRSARRTGRCRTRRGPARRGSTRRARTPPAAGRSGCRSPRTPRPPPRRARTAASRRRSSRGSGPGR